MRRIDRLRRAARKMAKEKGHDLGVFQDCPLEFYNPGHQRIVVRGKMYDGAYWLWARCVKCSEPVYISPTLSPHPDENGGFHGNNPHNPMFEIRAIKNTHAIHKAQKSAGVKSDFPERSLGVIHGHSVLLRDCAGVPRKIEIEKLKKNLP